MSRIRKGLHTVTVYPRTHSADAYGDVVETLGTGVAVQCNVQPSSANEILDLPGGLTPTTVYRIKYWPGEHGGAPWPGTSESLIEIDGQRFEQRGEPQISRMSTTTGHVKVFAVAYTPGKGGGDTNVMGRT